MKHIPYHTQNAQLKKRLAILGQPMPEPNHQIVSQGIQLSQNSLSSEALLVAFGDTQPQFVFTEGRFYAFTSLVCWK